MSVLLSSVPRAMESLKAVTNSNLIPVILPNNDIHDTLDCGMHVHRDVQRERERERGRDRQRCICLGLGLGLGTNSKQECEYRRMGIQSYEAIL